MRRIKSAPANLASMTNNKKNNILFLTKKDIIAIPMNNKYIPENKIKKVKEFKNNISFNSNLINDIVNDSNDLSIEESTIVFTFINYIANNILKREKMEELYNYLIQAIARYLIMLFIHSQILHEKIDIPFIDYKSMDSLSQSIMQIK